MQVFYLAHKSICKSTYTRYEFLQEKFDSFYQNLREWWRGKYATLPKRKYERPKFPVPSTLMVSAWDHLEHKYSEAKRSLHRTRILLQKIEI